MEAIVRMSRWMWVGVAGLVVAACAASEAFSVEEELSAAELAQAESTAVAEVGSAPRWSFAREPKAISEQAERGLDWLVARKLASGGWGQGEESEQMGEGLDHLVATADVADTCMAALALVRSGAAPGAGPRGEALARGVSYVCGEIEESDAESLYITTVRGTRVQMKIGTYVDTFLASMLLAEVKGRMASDEANERVERALAKVLDKIERNQQADGGFAGEGWAPVLSQSMAGKGINRAAQAGAVVDTEVNYDNNEYFLEQAEALSAPATDRSGTAIAGEGSAGAAGVPLYALSANLSGLQDFANSSAKREGELAEVLATSKDDGELAEARDELQVIERAKEGQKNARFAIVDRLDDPSFVGGFGSNGGEEFLSYMNVSESLVVDGGDAWKRWDEAVTGNLNRVQNQDGSWSGFHCITGRTFVTSAALLTLLADRTPVPVEVLNAAGDAEVVPVAQGATAK